MRPEMEQFRAVFCAEATELLAGMEQGLLALEGASEPAVIRDVFRAMHTLKGNASLLGFSAAARLAHVAEDVLEKLCDGAISMTPALLTLLLRSVDALRLEIGVEPAGERSIDLAADEIERRLLDMVSAEGQKDPPRSTNLGTSPNERPADATARREHDRTLRVELDRLDRMLDLMGEITVSRGQLAAMLGEADRYSREALLAAHREADGLHLALQELLMKARMVPIGRAFQPFARTVRDLSASMGKLVRLEQSGEDVEVDASIVELIHDPLMHLVRNAVDHGVEPPAARRARGKAPGGVVSLRASREASNIVVKVEDDGAGLDRDRIRARALAAGLLHEDEERDDASLFQFVFEPGFTTAERITEVSGRGIGMDVVKRNIEALRGSVMLDTTPGVGTVVSLRLPLSLSILEGFLVGVGQETYVLPLESVLECVDLPEEERGSGTTGVLSLRGHPLPYLRLRNYFHAEGAPPARESMVVVKHAAGKAGIAVDALLGQGQTVIKPLGKLLQRVPGISGSTILGNGRVALIIDVPAMIAASLSSKKNP